MKPRLALMAGLVACSTFLSAAPAVPKLFVIVVVDQMRADYVDRFRNDWTGGLKRLVTEGAWFSQAAYPYLTTVTCAGHATIGTGAYPHVHGVFQNIWFDRGRNQVVTCTQDANATPVSYGKPATGGDSAAALRIPTFADEMRRQRQSHVVSLALKARSAIMMAGHGGDAVSWISDSLDSWETSTAFSPVPIPAVRDYVAAHPMDADFGQTWNRLLPAAKYTETDTGLREASAPGWTPSFPHVLKGAATTTAADGAFFEQWQRSPFADAYVARMAVALTESMALGKGDRPDVLAVSFSSPDLVGHSFGPDSQEIRDMYAYLDQSIGVLLDGLDRAVGRGQYILALSADHGVTAIPEQLVAQGRDAGRIDPGPLALAIEQTAQKAGAGKYLARLVGNDVYFEPGMYAKLQAAPAVLDAIIGAIVTQPGIDRVLRADTLDPDPSPATERIARAGALSSVQWRGGELLVVPKNGWMFSSIGTTHGSASADDQRVPLILFGLGITRGEYQDAATPADIATTYAAIAGIKLPYAEGQVLRMAVPELATPTPSTGARR
jgi:predicted AlkP superfamily pyrophosphatase or phosphodiesterase